MQVRRMGEGQVIHRSAADDPGRAGTVTGRWYEHHSAGHIGRRWARVTLVSSTGAG